MDTYIDLEAQVLRDGEPFTRPTRWCHGLSSFTADPTQVAHWKLFPGAANKAGQEVVIYIQPLGWMTPEASDQTTPEWMLIRAMLMVDGVTWPQHKPGQVWIPPAVAEKYTLDDGSILDSYEMAYGGWTCSIHFDNLSNSDHHLAGVHTILLRGIREEQTDA